MANSATNPKSDEELANDPLEIIRGVLYTPIGRPGAQTKTQLSLFYESLNRSAMQGDTDASRDQRMLMKRLDQKKPERESARLSEGRRRFEESVRRHERRVAKIMVGCAFAYARIVHKLRTDHQRIHGSPLQEPLKELNFVDHALAEQVLRRLVKAEKSSRTGAEVGYGKPPVETRWKAGKSGNPSGKCKASGNGCDEFWAGLAQRHPVLVNGRTRKLPSAAIMCSRLVKQAIKGDPKARREVRNFVIELDQRNLLSPPPVRNSEKQKLVKLMYRNPIARSVIENHFIFDLKKSMQKEFSMVYGPDKTFLDDLERDYNTYIVLARFIPFREGSW